MIRAIHSLPALTDNYIYALVDDQQHCAIIDPGEAAPVLAFLGEHNLVLTDIFCTHHHLDHVGGIAALKHDFATVRVWTSAADFPRVNGATHPLQARGEWGGDTFEVLEVPGHTLGQVAYYFPRLAAVFVGDTLFSCGCGRMFEGTYPQFFASLQKFKRLPPETQIFFGHEYTLRNVDFVLSRSPASPALLAYKQDCVDKLASVGCTTPGKLSTELALSPFLRAKDAEEFREWRSARDSW